MRKSRLVLVTLTIGCLPFLQAQTNGDSKDWPAYGGSAASTHYSALTQINRDNVNKLEVAWTFDTGDATPGGDVEWESTPIKIRDTLYLISPKVRLFALDAATGKQKWVFDPNQGAANTWSGQSVDGKRGIVYIPLGSAASDFYGADRAGNDLFSDALVALDGDV